MGFIEFMVCRVNNGIIIFDPNHQLFSQHWLMWHHSAFSCPSLISSLYFRERASVKQSHKCTHTVCKRMMHVCGATEAWNCVVHVISGPRTNQIFPALISCWTVNFKKIYTHTTNTAVAFVHSTITKNISRINDFIFVKQNKSVNLQ